MDKQLEDTLGEIELRLSALEARQSQESAVKKAEEREESAWGYLWIPIPIAVFAWLSGQQLAWLMVGLIGVAAFLSAAYLSARRT